MAKLWGGRFSNKDMDPDVMSFTSSLNVDKILAGYDCLSSIVHVEMLAKIGVLTASEKKELLDVLNELYSKIKDGSFKFFDNYEDIHSAIQEYVENKAPKAGKKLHTARSRNEQVVNDVRLYCKDNIKEIKSLIIDLQKALIGLADKNSSLIIPGYTHLNRAQPVLFAHLLLAYVEMLGRDCGRLEDALKRCDVSVMGSGAIGGSSLKLDRFFVAKRLHFKEVSRNSIDSVSDRDFIAEFISGLCFIAVHLSRVCEDFILYSTSEFGFLEIGQDYCTGSSLMPQKKNPDCLELIRGRAAHVISSLNVLFVLLKGLPSSYNRDLQEDKKPLFESVGLVKDELTLMAKVIKTIKMKKSSLDEALEDEFMYAQDMAEYLVRKGAAFKDAHEIVGKIVKRCTEKGINISGLSIKELKNFSSKLDDDVYGLLNPVTSVENKKTPGSTNPAFVKNEIIKWKMRLKG